MKWSMMITEDTAQFNLKGENPHEDELLKILSKFTRGEVRIHQDIDVMRTNGGYLREFGQSPKVCAITIGKPVPVTIPEGA